MISDAELRRRYAHHPPKDSAVADTHERVREVLVLAAIEMNRLLPEGRSKALALTKLEEARLWANTAVALGE